MTTIHVLPKRLRDFLRHLGCNSPLEFTPVQLCNNNGHSRKTMGASAPSLPPPQFVKWEGHSVDSLAVAGLPNTGLSTIFH